MRFFATPILACLLLSLGGCGSSVANTCSASFSPCGGDIEGTWTIDTACNPSSALPSACAGVANTFTPNYSGSFAFNADKTYSQNMMFNESGTVTYPAACLASLSVTSCAQLDANTTSNGLTLKSSCTGDASKSCTCTVSETGDLMLTGTYATAGNDVTLTQSGNAGTPQGYCVNGSQLRLALPGVAGMTSSSAYVILTKQ
jgi:hypothetical protein